ncbi:MAG: 1,4-dihydroxy-2-naphthoate octaprenyltransferase [Bdellovibrionales bacterium]|nr:1,4-dihydroxy-2-naphthoate octaprenyltransferase [Bdellovibrionales bacterium]
MASVTRSWLLAFRPKTLPAAVAPVMTATALAHFLHYPIDFYLVSLLVIAILSLQIATNLFNDAIDFKKGADHKDRIGPVRVTQSGLFTAKAVTVMGVFFCAVTVIASIPLVITGGPPILLLGIISVALTYGYTGGPYPLAYKGLGDIFVVLFFGLIAVGGSFYVLTHIWRLEVLILGLQMGFLSTVLIAINNLRDSESDRLVGKKTLAVRCGDDFVKREIVALAILPFMLLFYWWITFRSYYFFIPLLAFPLALSIANQVMRVNDKRELNGLLARGGLLLLLFASSFTLACCL